MTRTARSGRWNKFFDQHGMKLASSIIGVLLIAVVSVYADNTQEKIDSCKTIADAAICSTNVLRHDQADLKKQVAVLEQKQDDGFKRLEGLMKLQLSASGVPRYLVDEVVNSNGTDSTEKDSL